LLPLVATISFLRRAGRAGESGKWKVLGKCWKMRAVAVSNNVASFPGILCGAFPQKLWQQQRRRQTVFSSVSVFSFQFWAYIFPAFLFRRFCIFNGVMHTPYCCSAARSLFHFCIVKTNANVKCENFHLAGWKTTTGFQFFNWSQKGARNGIQIH